jgi:cysteine desulfurase
MNHVYLDYNATAPLRPEARAAMMPHLAGICGNASSVHSFGHRAKIALESSRREVALLIGADPNCVVFTAGGSEANNLALFGAARAATAGARRVVTSAFEHPSVSSVIDDLEESGFDIVRVPPGGDGVVDAGRFLDAARPGTTAFASLMLANNEVGTLQPIAAIGAELRRRGIPFHCDAVQGIGKIPIDVNRLDVDLLTLAAHKFGGPQGVGALFIRAGMNLGPHLRGGGQEMHRRPGTENIAAIAGLGAAAHAVRNAEEEIPRLASLQRGLEAGVEQRGLTATINGGAAPRVPNTTSLAFPGTTGEALVVALDLEGIAVSAGSACSAGTLRSSPSLQAMGRPVEAGCSIRVSFGHATAGDHIDRLLDALGRVLPALRRAGRPVAVTRSTS